MKKSFIHQQQEISFVKNSFTQYLIDKLGIVEVQGPILSQVGDGMQDNLNGVEHPVSVHVKRIPNAEYEVVHSLAKWKRHTLARFGFNEGEGLFVHMKALRPDEEELDPIHSIYVDQWDWEKVIPNGRRNIEYLKETVEQVYKAIRLTELAVGSVRRRCSKSRSSGLCNSVTRHCGFVHSKENDPVLPAFRQRRHQRVIRVKENPRIRRLVQTARKKSLRVGEFAVSIQLIAKEIRHDGDPRHEGAGCFGESGLIRFQNMYDGLSARPRILSNTKAFDQRRREAGRKVGAGDIGNNRKSSVFEHFRDHMCRRRLTGRSGYGNHCLSVRELPNNIRTDSDRDAAGQRRRASPEKAQNRGDGSGGSYGDGGTEVHALIPPLFSLIKDRNASKR